MFIIGLINQIKNLCLKLWSINLVKALVIFCIAAPYVFSYGENILSSLITRGTISVSERVEAMVLGETLAQQQANSSTNSGSSDKKKDGGGDSGPSGYTGSEATSLISQIIIKSIIFSIVASMLYRKSVEFTAKKQAPPIIYTGGRNG
ncbi:MAG: hypothetical protein BEN18_06300 [Epulopiscium sp. Nuni2H_MBin001]|nr:MAG: hypothetical protein BEN18_06300 [Epulopiscium sp. Nuni2H_MBin001]